MPNHDYLSDRLANLKLMADIRRWWQKRGIIARVTLDKVPNPRDGGSMYVIRTHIPQDVQQARLGNVVG